MPDRFPTRRIDLPPSTITGPLAIYLAQMATALNAIPKLSYTSYAGGPESNVTGAQGDLLINLAVSDQTARLYLKEQGSGNVGWVSFTTV